MIKVRVLQLKAHQDMGLDGDHGVRGDEYRRHLPRSMWHGTRAAGAKRATRG